MKRDPLQRIVIENTTLISGTGEEPREDVSIFIEGSRIKAIGRGEGRGLRQEVRTIHGEGMYVMPGLIDSHLHLLGMRSDDFVKEKFVVSEKLALLRAAEDVRELLESGFTTVRDCGSCLAIYLRDAILEGTLRGPRIVASGFMLSQTFGHGDDHYLPPSWVDYRESKRGFSLLCDGEAECKKATRYALRTGADFIKICTSGGILSSLDTPEHVQFSRGEIEAMVEVAQQSSTFVASHAQNDTAIKNAILAGVKTIEHGFGLTEETIELAKSYHTIFCPTLSLDQAIKDKGEGVYPPWAVEKQKAYWEQEIEDTRHLYEAGLTVAIGTDFLGSPLSRMGENAKELELLVQYCGLSPMEVIVAATLHGAMACGLGDSIGSIEEGKVADLLVLDRDPLEDIHILQKREHIPLVLKEGEIVVNRLG